MGNEEGMSWETTDVLSADTTDVLSADTTDVLSADTTDGLSTPCSSVGRLELVLRVCPGAFVRRWPHQRLKKERSFEIIIPTNPKLASG